MANITLLFDVWGVQRPITSSYKLNKAPVKKGNSFAVTPMKKRSERGLEATQTGSAFSPFSLFISGEQASNLWDT